MTKFWKYDGKFIKASGAFVKCPDCPCTDEPPPPDWGTPCETCHGTGVCDITETGDLIGNIDPPLDTWPSQYYSDRFVNCHRLYAFPCMTHDGDGFVDVPDPVVLVTNKQGCRTTGPRTPFHETSSGLSPVLDEVPYWFSVCEVGGWEITDAVHTLDMPALYACVSADLPAPGTQFKLLVIIQANSRRRQIRDAPGGYVGDDIQTQAATSGGYRVVSYFIECCEEEEPPPECDCAEEFVTLLYGDTTATYTTTGSPCVEGYNSIVDTTGLDPLQLLGLTWDETDLKWYADVQPFSGSWGAVFAGPSTPCPAGTYTLHSTTYGSPPATIEVILGTP